MTAGSTVTYTLTARNGPSTAAGVTITDPLPLGLNFASASPAGVCTNASGTVTCSVGALAPNASSTVSITAGVSSNVAAGTITNTATAKSATPDPDNTNNTASVPVTVATSADLALSKTVAPTSAIAGTAVSYTLTLSNAGPSDAAE